MILLTPNCLMGNSRTYVHKVILPRCRLEMGELVWLGANRKIAILPNFFWRLVLLSHLWRWSASQELSFKKWEGM